MSFFDISDPIPPKEALKMHIRAHNELGRRPKIPEEAFSKIDDASTTTADSWLKAYDNAEEKDKGKALFQVAIEEKAENLHELDIEDLAGGHYYLSAEETLLAVPAANFLPTTGGFGVVWNGMIKEKIYAVKTISGAASLALEWKLEREILKSLSHEHLVRLLFSMEQENTVHMVIHPYTSITLAKVLTPTESPINLKEYPGWLQNAFCCLLSALRFLHSKNIKHLGLKPQNVLIDNSVNPPNVLISNFGASSRFTITSAPNPPEQPGFTRWYAAPEQFHSQGRRSADVFSIAVIFLEIFVFIRMGIKIRSPQQVLSDPKGLGQEGAGKVGSNRVQELVDRIAEGAVVWLVELASMLKSMLAYTPMKRPTARHAHVEIMHIVVGGAATELHCPVQTAASLDTESDRPQGGDDGEQSEVVDGVLDEFLRTMQKRLLPSENSASNDSLKDPNSPALVQFSSHTGFTNAANTAEPDQPGPSETPRKRALEDTEQEETEGVGKEENQPKKAKK